MSPQPAVDAELTLVIPTLGRSLLRRTLESVIAGSVWPSRVIVVDQGRKTEIESLAGELCGRGLDVQYLPTATRGKSAGLNLGIAAIERGFLAITDDDCPVAPDWIARLGARLRQHPGCIVTGRAEAGEGDVQLVVATSGRESVQRRPALRFDLLIGANIGMSLDVARHVGPFMEDLSMRAAEDTEYAYRALRRGVPIVYAPELVVYHLGWRDEDGRNDQYRGYARSHGAFYGWYLRRGDVFIAARMAVHLVRALRRWIVGAIRGDGEGARKGRAYVLGMWPGVVEGWHASGRSL
jgi:GT2 family glycosyltransferase